MNSFEQSVDDICDECRQALHCVEPQIIERLLKLILSAEKVYFVGVGRVMMSLMATAKRLSHLGLNTHCVGEIAEPAITPNDLLVVGSGSGESIVPVAIAQKAHTLGVRIVHIGSNPNSSLSPITSLFVRIPVQTKLALDGEIHSRQPMTSLFEQCLWLLGDVLAAEIIRLRQLDVQTLWKYHANLE